MTKIMDLWPPIMQELREFQKIAEIEDVFFEKLWQEIENIVDDQFIQTATEKGIARREKMLKVVPSADDTLQSRIFRVIARWNDRIPYTWNSLLNKLDVLCGEGNYTIILRNDEYTIDLTTHIGIYDGLDELYNLLDKMIPCNLIINAENILFAQKETALHLGSATICGLHYILTSNIDEDYELKAKANLASGIVDGMHYMLTSNIDENYQVSSDAKLGSTVTGGTVYSLKSAD